MIASLRRRWRNVKYQARRLRWYFTVSRRAMKNEEFRAYVQEHGSKVAAAELTEALYEIERENLVEKYVTVHHGDGTKSYRRKDGT